MSIEKEEFDEEKLLKVNKESARGKLGKFIKVLSIQKEKSKKIHLFYENNCRFELYVKVSTLGKKRSLRIAHESTK